VRERERERERVRERDVYIHVQKKEHLCIHDFCACVKLY
jgi:hypothetical protein